MMSIEDFKDKGFSINQLSEIEEGLKSGIDVSLYARKEFYAIQMRQIRLGLEEGIDVKKYALPEYDWFQMEEIRKGLSEGLNVSVYANPDVTYDRMRQIRKGLRNNIDLSPYKNMKPGVLRVLRKAVLAKVSILQYINEGYEEKQLDEIRLALEKGLSIRPLINVRMRGVCIREIAAGLYSNVDASIYATLDYNWRQMREIRYGLENRVEVKYYLSPYYDWEQMQEIRLGLQKGIDVSSYRSYMYPGPEMRVKRLALEKKAEDEDKYWLDRILENVDGSADILNAVIADQKNEQHKTYDDFSVTVSPDEMEVIFSMNGRPHPINKNIIDDALDNYGITNGIDDLAVSRLVNGDWKEKTLIVAKGTYPTPGKDGWYEYFFRTNVARTPKILPDGSVDYHDVEWFERVTQNQKLAEYHPAIQGTDGMTVTGKVVPAKRCKEQHVLGGTGFYMDSSKLIYFAATDGIVELSENRLEVRNLLVLNDVSLATGDVSFEGDVYVKGNVFSGMNIRCGGDLVVDGFVEKVRIECGGSVLLKKGVNSSMEGYISAAKDVVGTFFEGAKICAGGEIRANYSLNSELVSSGKIIISGKKGSLVGGTATAELGIEANEIGNKAGTVTTLRLGSQDANKTKLDSVAAQIKDVMAELTILRNGYKDFEKNYAVETRNSMPIFHKIEDAIYTKEQQLNDLMSQKGKLEFLIKDIAKAEIVAKGTLFDSVIINIGRARFVSRTVQGVRLKLHENRVAMFSL